MHDSHNALHWKEPISHHTEKEWRNDGTDGTDEVCQINDISHAMALHIIPARGIPRSPDKELKEHHGHQAHVEDAVHGLCEG